MLANRVVVQEHNHTKRPILELISYEMKNKKKMAKQHKTQNKDTKQTDTHVYEKREKKRKEKRWNKNQQK